jgi:hypothetical protein
MSCMVLVGCAQAEEKGKTGDETKNLCTHRYKSSEKIVVVNRQSVSCETVEPSNSWTALFFLHDPKIFGGDCKSSATEIEYSRESPQCTVLPLGEQCVN